MGDEDGRLRKVSAFELGQDSGLYHIGCSQMPSSLDKTQGFAVKGC